MNGKASVVRTVVQTSFTRLSREDRVKVIVSYIDALTPEEKAIVQRTSFGPSPLHAIGLLKDNPMNDTYREIMAAMRQEDRDALIAE